MPVKVLQGTRLTIKQSFYGCFCSGWRERRVSCDRQEGPASIWHVLCIAKVIFFWLYWKSKFSLIKQCFLTRNDDRWYWFVGRSLVYPMESQQWKQPSADWCVVLDDASILIPFSFWTLEHHWTDPMLRKRVKQCVDIRQPSYCTKEKDLMRKFLFFMFNWGERSERAKWINIRYY